MERVFTFLFKYRPLLFQEGDLVLSAPWPVLTALAVGGVVAAAGVVTYARASGKASRAERGVMAGLRLGAMGVLLLCLLQPALLLTSVVPQRNFVGILVDDSRSMGLADASGRTRADWIRESLGPEGSELLDALSERFALRFFRFSGETSRVTSVDELTFEGTRTDLGAALEHAREELSAVPLSGLVVFTDGGDNAGTPLARTLVPLQAASVPVYAVGLGDDAVTPDVQIDRVEGPRSVLRGTSLVVDAVVTGRGMSGRTVPLVVEDQSRILATQDVTLPGGGEPAVVRVRFELAEPGLRRIRFRVPPQEGERVDRNNERTLLVDVRGGREKILYFEGEPRWELKFLRRAVADDDNLQLVVLARTAENKFMRMEVDDSLELASGFPRTRDELFRYRALVLGSVEASFFTHDQLAMIADFVSQRGGGLLVLGGRSALAEGGYAGTPVEDALPVLLEEPADPATAFVEVHVQPTPAGLHHVATQILPGAADPRERWDSLPTLTTVNRIERVKPGATVLLDGVTGDGTRRVALAHHRFGRGKALVLPVQDSWIWQMHADIALDDLTHETFWRQLLRWLVDGVPEHVGATVASERVEAGEAVEILVEVSDSAYLEVNDALVSASVAAPDGSVTVVPLDWTVERDGEYRGTFRPHVEGPHQVSVEAARGDAAVGTDAVHVEVGPSDAEYFDAGLRRPLLERLARETGGRFYTPASVADLPEDLTFTGGGVTLVEERDLWDMPFLFLLLVGLVGSEWVFRRRRGLV